MMHLNRLLGTGILSRAAGRFLILLTVLMILGSFAAASGEEGFSINNVSQATDAELEDALMLLNECRADGDPEELTDALEDMKALAGDYRGLAGDIPELAALADQLEMAADMALGNL